MDREDLVLAVLAAGGHGSTFAPAQLQKLFFLIDREIPDAVGGPHFLFKPYDYGPFDSALYFVLEDLAAQDMVAIAAGGRYRRYQLTSRGQLRGDGLLATMAKPAKQFAADAAAWVNSLTFAQLVSAIYQKYPEMKARSIFRG